LAAGILAMHINVGAAWVSQGHFDHRPAGKKLQH
jgi:hypothetical protein